VPRLRIFVERRQWIGGKGQCCQFIVADDVKVAVFRCGQGNRSYSSHWWRIANTLKLLPSGENWSSLIDGKIPKSHPSREIFLDRQIGAQKGPHPKFEFVVALRCSGRGEGVERALLHEIDEPE
jgi:hypothetical protein